jgi:hypothetical protein
MQAIDRRIVIVKYLFPPVHRALRIIAITPHPELWRAAQRAAATSPERPPERCSTVQRGLDMLLRIG